jgi:hypothetical protein
MESETLEETTIGAVFEAILLGVGSGDPTDSSEMTAPEWEKFESDINDAFERIS